MLLEDARAVPARGNRGGRRQHRRVGCTASLNLDASGPALHYACLILANPESQGPAPSPCRTPSLARKQGAKVIRSARGRGRQMNAGADQAAGSVLCFLHADTLPPLNLVCQPPPPPFPSPFRCEYSNNSAIDEGVKLITAHVICCHHFSGVPCADGHVR